MFSHFEDNLDRVRAALDKHYSDPNSKMEIDVVLLASLANEVSFLRGLYLKAVAERDESRRETCYVISQDLANGPNLMSPDQVAMEYGWDCFTKKGY